jgi:CDP-glucose 4,6-dehydratase
MFSSDFYRGKRVFLTGHTGFKGGWMTAVLLGCGAEVSGYSLSPPTAPALFELAGLAKQINSTIHDIRDRQALQKALEQAKPDIVLHMAAQPIVRDSYRDPVTTYETNVMGTVNLLESIRTMSSPPRSVVNITTDKVYQNNEWCWGYRENEPLDGYDPYSNSKSCSELVTHSYVNSFFKDAGIAVSTARAGNVIGGGDYANDRIIPDCVRAAQKKEPIIVRNPHSVRPYQHVLEPVFAYLLLAQRQWENNNAASAYNVGPDDIDCVSTGDLVDSFCTAWGQGQSWESRSVAGPHEANFLKLDCSKFKNTFGWLPAWHIRDAVAKTVEWQKGVDAGQSPLALMQKQIEAYRAAADANKNAK